MHHPSTFLIGATALAFLAGAQPIAAQVDFEPNDVFDGRTIAFEVPREAIQAKSLLDRGNDKIDPAIRTLIAASGGQVGGFAAQAKSLGVPLGAAARSVAVTLLPDRRSSVDALIAEAEDHGAEISAVFEDVIYASVPLDQVEALGASTDLHYLSQQTQYYPSYPAAAAAGNLAAEGVKAIQADRLHAEGLTGRGVKVGILDFGFHRYSALQRAGQLPAPKAQRAFNDSGRVEAESEHGTACAEIIHAMAPDADLYLAAVTGREEQVVQAAFWLADQGVDIVSYSGGGHAGPHDGTSILDKLVEEIASRGILWVNAAGNEGASHWGGPATDSDGDGWIEMGPNGENFMFVRPKGNGVILEIIWDDWGDDPKRPSSTQDIDAYLLAYDPFTGRIVGPPVAVSANPQRGRGKPTELLSGPVPANVPYLLALRATSVSRPVRIHVHSHSLAPAELAPLVPDGSIAIPATSTMALAVGAVDVRNDRLEAYSSNGPTDDGRTKPEVSAPDQTPSAFYNGRFSGTSAACPHVSGFAALLKQWRPSAKRAELTAYIQQAVRPMGTGQPNNQFGFGHIDASKLDLGDGGGTLTQQLELPGNWGGSIAFAELDAQLETARSRGDLNLKVAVGRPEYRIGDGLKVGISADEACYYLLLGRDSRGDFAVISPLGDDRQRLRAGEKRAFPERGTIRVTGPPGRDEVILIGSRRPLDPRTWRGEDSISVARISYRVVR